MFAISRRFILCAQLFVIIYIGASILAVEPEDGVDLFLKAIISQQSHSKIVSGKISFSIAVNEYKTDKEIQDEADRWIASAKKGLPPGDPRIEVVERNAYQATKEHYAQAQLSSGTFRFDNSQKDYQYSEIQMTYNQPSGEPFHTIRAIEKRGKYKRIRDTEAAVLDTSITPQVFVDKHGGSIAEFSQFGHVRGILANLVDTLIESEGEEIAKDEIERQLTKAYGNKKEMKILKIVETKPFDDGATSYILESALDGKVTQRYTIVPSLGYICPKIEFFDLESGNPIETYEAKDFVKHTPSGLYYPTYYTEQRYNASSGELLQKKEYSINQETLLLNEKMSPKDFALDIPQGYQIQDTRDINNVGYMATESGVLSLDSGGLDLEKMTWLRRVDSSSQVPTEYKSLLLRVVFLVVGVILVAWGLSRRRRNKKNAAV